MNVIIDKKRYREIDICRGIGIILVVLGHALKQTGKMNLVFEILLSVIYSFHMPLFFLVSGFVAVKILDFHSVENKLNYVKSRVVRLLVPYFAVGLFYMPIKFALSSFAVKPYDFSSAWKILIGENPNTVLWFLYTLFWVSCVSVFVLKYKNLEKMVGLSGCVALVAYLCNSPVEFLKYWFFFLAGIYLRVNYEKVLSIITGRSVAALTVLFALSNVLLYVTEGSGWIFVTAITGCFCTLALSLKMKDTNRRTLKIVEVCGKYSMDIYILSDLIATAIRILLWGILNVNYLVCTLICFIFSMLLPIPISKYIIQKVRIFKLLILGSR